mgnify:CR=1 FL=1
MQVCMDRIRLYKEEAGLTLSEEDIHGTWLIGAPVGHLREGQLRLVCPIGGGAGNAEGLPVIHLLNTKQLAADYGLPYDPQRLPAPGESAVYHTAGYPWHWAGGGLALA